MDRTVKILLAIAITIIYPILVGVFSILLFQTIAQDEYPKAIYCTEIYDSYNSRGYSNYKNSQYDYESNYDRQYKDSNNKIYNSYDECNKAKEKNDKLIKSIDKKNSEKVFLSSLTALLIGLVTLVGIYFFRSVKALAGGLLLGSSFIIVVTSSLISLDNPMTRNSGLNLVGGIAILVAFIASVILLKLNEINEANNQNDSITGFASTSSQKILSNTDNPSSKDSTNSTPTV